MCLYRRGGSNPLPRTQGRLAQLVERVLDVNDVIGSSPIPPTTKQIYLLSIGLECRSDVEIAIGNFYREAGSRPSSQKTARAVTESYTAHK